MIQVLELPLRVTSIHRLDSFKPFLKVEDWTHRRSRFSRSLSLQKNSSVDTDPILTYEIVVGGRGGGTLRYIWDTTYAMKPDKSKKHMHIILWNRGKYSQSHYSPRLKRIVVLVYAQEVISTKSEKKPLKSTISLIYQITRKFIISQTTA